MRLLPGRASLPKHPAPSSCDGEHPAPTDLRGAGRRSPTATAGPRAHARRGTVHGAGVSHGCSHLATQRSAMGKSLPSWLLGIGRLVGGDFSVWGLAPGLASTRLATRLAACPCLCLKAKKEKREMSVPRRCLGSLRAVCTPLQQLKGRPCSSQALSRSIPADWPWGSPGQPPHSHTLPGGGCGFQPRWKSSRRTKPGWCLLAHRWGRAAK